MKKFDSAEMDAALVATIHHESFLTKAAFDEFGRLGTRQVMLGLTKLEQVQLFTAYCSFLHHLYELYVAIFMREQGSDKGFSGSAGAAKRDALFTDMAGRIFAEIHERLSSGKGEGWENDISYYVPNIPADFAPSFRRLRNSTAHAITERVEGGVNLSDFYRDYHKYVYHLYRFAHSYWSRYDIEQLDMQAIGNFSVIVRK